MATLGAAVILNAVLLQRAKTSAAGLRTFNDMNIKDMVLVGLAQALSVLPGLSRSGMTTTTLLLLGFRPDEAFKASFVLVPVAGLGATILSYLSEGGAVATSTALAAFVAGIAVSLVTIKALLRFARSKHVVLVNFVIGALAVAGGLLKVLAG
jgi:undecaprenyl-diphosphatase